MDGTPDYLPALLSFWEKNRDWSAYLDVLDASRFAVIQLWETLDLLKSHQLPILHDIENTIVINCCLVSLILK